jgi:hypothetical protein
MLVDVAISSFRKPESLIYTLLTLHRHCRDRVGTVWICDDRSGDGSVQALTDPALHERLAPWTIHLHVARRRGGTGRTMVTPQMAWHLALPGQSWQHRLRSGWFLVTRGHTRARDIRYEAGLAGSEAAHVLVLHDDVEVRGDVAGHLLGAMQADDRVAIAGPLGQCWRCGWQGICSPRVILSGGRPGAGWPLTPPPPALAHRRYDRACRINEWCCMIRTEAARQLSRDGIHFGNAEDGGDTGAYWFGAAVARGWRFVDPFLNTPTDRWYRHGWQGHAGHAVWADDPAHRRAYDVAMIRSRIQDEFAFTPKDANPLSRPPKAP